MFSAADELLASRKSHETVRAKCAAANAYMAMHVTMTRSLAGTWSPLRLGNVVNIHVRSTLKHNYIRRNVDNIISNE